MIDIEEVKTVIRTRIAESLIFDISDIAWENVQFDPANKAIWMQENYIPAIEAEATMTSNFANGIYQFTINTPLDSSDTLATSKSVELGNLFKAFEVIETTNYRASIKAPSRSFEGNLDDLWYKVIIDVTLNIYEK